MQMISSQLQGSREVLRKIGIHTCRFWAPRWAAKDMELVASHYLLMGSGCSLPQMMCLKWYIPWQEHVTYLQMWGFWSHNLHRTLPRQFLCCLWTQKWQCGSMECCHRTVVCINRMPPGKCVKYHILFWQQVDSIKIWTGNSDMGCYRSSFTVDIHQ